SRRRKTRFSRDWSSDVCSADLNSYIFLMCRNIAINHIHKAAHEKKYKEHLIHAWNHLQIRGKTQVEKNMESEYFVELLEHGLSQTGRASCREMVQIQPDAHARR